MLLLGPAVLVSSISGARWIYLRGAGKSFAGLLRKILVKRGGSDILVAMSGYELLVIPHYTSALSGRVRVRSNLFVTSCHNFLVHKR